MKKWWIIALSLGCGSELQTVTDPNKKQEDPDDDVEGPNIEHDPIDGSQPGGTAVQVTAEVTDELSNVMAVKLYYSKSTSTDWLELTMSVDSSTGEYRGTIPGGHIGSAEMRYYIYAVDGSFNETVDPEDADQDWLEAYTFGVSTR